MAAFDAASESHTGTTGSSGEASFTWNHAGAASGVKGVVVFVKNLTSADDYVTSVTYGGVTMNAVTGGFAQDTAGEAGSVKAYHLGASIPQGTQAIVVNRTNNAAELYATAGTVTGTNDTEYAGVTLEQEDQALTETNVDDGSPGTSSVRFAGIYSGVANITAAIVPGTNSTLLGAIDIGGNVAMSVYETTPGQGSRPVGCVAASDDVAAVYLAVREVAGSTDRRYQLSFTEFELPNEPRRYQVSFTELEVPDEPRRYQVSWAEFEVPDEPRRYQLSFTELEVPDAPLGDRRYQVSFVELEVPNEPRRYQMSFTELEIPELNRRYLMSFTELEVPNDPSAPGVQFQRAAYVGVQAPY